MSERKPSERNTAIFRVSRFALLPALAVALGLSAGPAAASIRHHHGNRAAAPAGALTDPGKDAALILDGSTGKIIYSRNADATRHPASLTKMMTLYLLFEQLKNGQVTMATPIPVSEHASIQHKTKLYLRAGTSIPVESAIRAIVVCSANDVAVAIAEKIGGTESHFAEMMTEKAREFGMTHTFYHNASGLPDDLQVTSAGDLAILARHLAYDFPQYFPYFSTQTFTWHGETHKTTDHLIGAYQGADGIKTGYTQASGFNLVSSVVRGGAHVIAVVMGGRTAQRRDKAMVNLLDTTFAEIDRNPTLVARANVPWQTIAQNTLARPVIAGFQIAPAAIAPHPAAPEPVPNNSLPAAADSDDEAAAEARMDQDQALPAPAPAPSMPVAQAAPQPPKVVPPAAPIRTAMLPPQPVRVVGLPEEAKPEAQAPTPIPLPRPDAPVMLAAYHPRAVPAAMPKAKPAPATDTDATDPGITHELQSAQNIHGWTIQIGAFGDAITAKAQLSAYAERSTDVLGQASRIVVPFQSADGHTFYRARFGPFAEREAREVCERLTERGQTCFAALAAR